MNRIRKGAWVEIKLGRSAVDTEGIVLRKANRGEMSIFNDQPANKIANDNCWFVRVNMTTENDGTVRTYNKGWLKLVKD